MKEQEKSRQQTAEGIRCLADLVETTDLKLLDLSCYYVFLNTTEELAKAAKILASITGRVEKSVDEGYYYVTADFGLFKLKYTLRRSSVCTSRIIGRKTQTRNRQIRAPIYASVIEEVDEVVWDCPPLLLELFKGKETDEG